MYILSYSVRLVFSLLSLDRKLDSLAIASTVDIKELFRNSMDYKIAGNYIYRQTFLIKHSSIMTIIYRMLYTWHYKK